ncbi:MAG: hypothetical protein IJK96_05915 [Bacteroidales bacterium]|nr:hypothetical protein [Bacteroidales bacterium]
MDFLRKTYLAIFFLAAFAASAGAQFREEAFQQSYVDPNDTTAVRDTVDKMFSFKEYFGGLRHKNELRIGTLFGGSTVFIGGEQIYNKQYWKLPVIYGGLGATIGMGIHYNGKYRSSKKAFDEAFALDPETTLTVDKHSRDLSRLFFAGAGLIYWATLMDGVVSYKSDIRPHPGKSTLYSILLPGLGQAYNGEYWKIPIYWAGIIGSCHYYSTNATNYKRYKRIHNEATNPDIEYTGPISAETALYYRNTFRRYRDYSAVALFGFYLLQIIDANVFAYMQDFEVSDDLTVNLSPTVIVPETNYALSGTSSGSAFGLRLGLTF